MSRKEHIGIVISNKMDKTIIVEVKKQIPHKKYKKIMIKTNKYYVHDNSNQCKIGDTVKIEEARPLSKNKRWNLITRINKK